MRVAAVCCSACFAARCYCITAGWGETEVLMEVSSRRLAIVQYRHLPARGLLSLFSLLRAFSLTVIKRNQGPCLVGVWVRGRIASCCCSACFAARCYCMTAGWGETEVLMDVSSRRLARVLHRHLAERGLLSFLRLLLRLSYREPFN